MNPLGDNPLKTRTDLQRAVRAMFEPLIAHFTPGGAQVLPLETRAGYTTRGAGLEGLARPLWGIAALAAGGGSFDHWELYHRGLTCGADPNHPEYWGQPPDGDQRFVEAASLGFALSLAPQNVWRPLAAEARANLARWLDQANHRMLWENNWLFFRVLANLGLARVGAQINAAASAAATEKALDRLEEFYLRNGWYSDGPDRPCDYYVAFAFHFYGLIYAKLADTQDPQRCARFRHRAREFAGEFIHWFTNRGEALPYGRSLIYRFAQASFWGALAFADVEALPWGIIKGLALRNLRSWAMQPIFTPDGVLSLGYAYPQLTMTENYNGPGAPYWAMKFFLPLALDEGHPFWQAEEAPLPARRPIHVLAAPKMVMCHEDQHDHTVALVAGQPVQASLRHVAEKYQKFAYSTHFGFCVPCSANEAATDSTLALSEDGRGFRVREKIVEARVETTEDGRSPRLYSRWQPWADVEIETWLQADGPWHLRVHRIRSHRPLIALESSFALNIGGELLDRDEPNAALAAAAENKTSTAAGFASLQSARGGSGIRDLIGGRTGEISPITANSNLLHPRVAWPLLRCMLPPGEHRLACAVTGSPSAAFFNTHWQNAPSLPRILTAKDASPEGRQT